MENKKFVHEEDLPSKERAILILLDVVREKMKKSKGRESQSYSMSAENLAGAINRMLL